MSTNSTNGQYRRPSIDPHAADQYIERFQEGDLPLRNAWEQAVQVEAPDKHYHEARLYPPADLLMTCKNGVVTTVLFASKTRIEAPGKVRCGGCGHPHEPLLTTETCPWCGATAEAGRSTGAITLTRTEGDR